MPVCRSKHPPRDEREERLRCTLICCISQKLERMEVSDLKDIYTRASQLIQAKKRKENKFEGKKRTQDASKHT